MSAAGPSGIDACGWQMLCASFHVASDEICGVIALFARRLCITFLSLDILSPLLACQLNALNRSLGLFEFVRWCNVYCGKGNPLYYSG